MKDFKILNFWWALLPVIIISCDPDTSSSPEPEDVFVKFYGHAATETAADFLLNQGADGQTGYVIFGTTNSSFLVDDGEGGDADYYLIFTDLAGNQLSAATYDALVPDENGNLGNYEQTASKVIQTADGGFLMVGTVSGLFVSSGLDGGQNITRAHVVKVDADGVEQFSFVYPSPQATNITEKTQGGLEEQESIESVADVIQTADGNILMIGSTSNIDVDKPDLPNPATDPKDIWLIKFDPTNLAGLDSLPPSQIIFENQLGFPGEDDGSAIFERPDGSLVIVANGQGKSDGIDKDILFVTADADGFNNNFQEEGSTTGDDDFVTEVQLLSDGGVVVVGYTSTSEGDRTMLSRFTSSGSLDFFNVIQLDSAIDSNGTHRGFGVAQTLSGDLAIVGEIEDVDVEDNSIAQQESRRNDILFITTDGFGVRNDQSIEKNYGGTENDLGEAVVELQDPDGTRRFVILSTIDFEGGSTMISLMKTSSSGNLVR